ncbi:MAG: amino acid ABC transporter substrate-binding protein [Caldilineaceae bacterium]|nr:amino acid ABC transporter substrate-binding protein [Caldilineaceae bacterium]
MKQWYWVVGVSVILIGVALFLFGTPERVVRLLRRDSTWQTMQANGVWRVGMDASFPPFEWLDENGQPIGYDVELAERMAAAWGLELRIVPIGFDSLGDALQTGQIDSVVSALPYDERLTRNIAYSAPYFDAGLALATLPDSSVQSVADLAGQTVAVELGSMGDMVGRRLQREDPSIAIERYDTPEQAVAALEDGSVEALLVDHITLRMAQISGSPLVRVGPLLESNPYVIAMPIHAYELQDAVAERLAQLQAEGILAEMEAKWFNRVE